MNRSVLITGGAGFIGSHVADALLARGDRVRVLDNLSPQGHGEARTRPEYLSDRVELQVGDVRDPAVVRRAVEGVDVVYHLAAAADARPGPAASARARASRQDRVAEASHELATRGLTV